MLLPSNLVDTTDLKTSTQELRLASDRRGPFQWVVGGFYSDIDRIYRQRLPTPGYDAFTDATLRRRHVGGDRATASRPIRPTTPTCPTTSSRSRCSARRRYDFTDAVHAHRRRPLLRLRGRAQLQLGRPVLQRRQPASTRPRRTASARASSLSYEVGRQRPRQRPGVEGLPARRRQRSAQHAALHAPQDDAHLRRLPRPMTTRRCGTTKPASVASSRGITFTAAAFYTDISDLQVTLDAGTCSSRVVFNVPKAHTMGIEVELSASPVEGLDLSIDGSIVEAEFDSDRADGRLATSSPASARATACRRVPKFQIAASASYTGPVPRQCRGLCRRQLPACRQPLHPAERPGEQSAHASSHGLPFGGATGTARRPSVDLRLPVL